MTYSDINLVHEMIKEKTNEIDKMHAELYDLQTRLKTQQQDRDDVIIRLTRDNDESMKNMISLENKIQEYEKKNEKTNADTVNNY